MEDRYSRTRLLIKDESLELLKNRSVIVFGIGGVGGYTAEALSRTGVGHITLVDSDMVNESNINRQIIALSSTIGRYKVDVMKERINDINPEIKVDTYKIFYNENTKNLFDFKDYDYVVDAIDTVSAKIDIIERCYKENIPVISAMGAGNKMDPTMFMVTDIYKTEMDPLSKVMRKELKKRGIKKLKVVYSKEKPVNAFIQSEGSAKRSPGSIAFIPSVSGLIIAGEVIKDLTGYNKNEAE